MSGIVTRVKAAIDAGAGTVDEVAVVAGIDVELARLAVARLRAHGSLGPEPVICSGGSCGSCGASGACVSGKPGPVPLRLGVPGTAADS